MPLILTDEQEMLKESARGFLDEKAAVTALRKLRDERSEEGFSRALWKEMAEMGWAGILVDEAHGGSGFGFVGAGGLGQQLDSSMKMFAGGEVSTMLLVFIALVGLADFISSWLRRQLG